MPKKVINTKYVMLLLEHKISAVDGFMVGFKYFEEKILCWLKGGCLVVQVLHSKMVFNNK